jgi:hypothetical protein
MIVVQGDADLFEVVIALRPPRRLPRRLDGRQQHHHQQLNQGKTVSFHGFLILHSAFAISNSCNRCHLLNATEWRMMNWECRMQIELRFDGPLSVYRNAC